MQKTRKSKTPISGYSLRGYIYNVIVFDSYEDLVVISNSFLFDGPGLKETVIAHRFVLSDRNAGLRFVHVTSC